MLGDIGRGCLDTERVSRSQESSAGVRGHWEGVDGHWQVLGVISWGWQEADVISMRHPHRLSTTNAACNFQLIHN